MLFFIMNVFVPIGTILSACLGCDFILINYSVFAVITAVTSVYTVIFSFVCKKSVQDKWIQIIFAILPFLSLINALFYFFKSNGSWIFKSVWISFICCIILAIKYGKPQTVYIGEWGEFKNMRIYWKNDECLVINSMEYEIDY